MVSAARSSGTAAKSHSAAAKLNLFLEITGRRADGYHELQSLVAFADFGDRLWFEPAAVFALKITGPFAQSLAAGARQDNLVLKAASWLRARVRHGDAQAITLEKNLPVAAGIGGGSADAAAALRALAVAWEIDPSSLDCAQLARDLGADLPVCLLGRPCLVSGVGEKLAPAPRLPKLWLLLANPRLPLSTGAVFNAYSPPYSEAAGWPASDLDLPAFVDALKTRRNDLEAPARSLLPEIGELLGSLQELPGCLLARMSGSGPTCFGLFARRSEAEAGAAHLQVAHPGWWLCSGRLQST
jgi:4-diphosphocytidyl-2-C-methyl-D-erythritol kinase